MTDFHDINLPYHIGIFALSRVEFSTFCAKTKSGREVRNANSLVPTRNYSLKNCHLSKTQFESFYNFFYARCGQRFAFRLRDSADFRARDQIIGKGDGSLVEFQLVKIYPDPISPYIREINKPRAESIKIYQGENFFEIETLDLETGKVKLTAPPANDQELYASFDFDVMVRFNKDSFQYSFNNDGTISLDDVNLVEVV